MANHKQKTSSPKKPLSKAELEDQLTTALEETFPASDPVAVGEVSAEAPDRPLHRKPAKIDRALVDRLAAEVASKRPTRR